LKKVLTLFKMQGKFGQESVAPRNSTNAFGEVILDSQKFSLLNEGDRISQIMLLGDSGREDALGIIIYALSKDKSKGVRFAALKRVHNFSQHPNIMKLVEGLPEIYQQSELEPYYSMALFRLGKINEAE